jgi:asparagine synthase (glutamine-hydrolysing)
VVLDPAASAGSGAALARMHQPIRHRGPDGEGFLAVDAELRAAWRQGPGETPADALLGMAFRRLKILDLSEAAAQPMASADGLTWIVFNGEVYNFRELRRELAGQGRSFRSTGDTEVVLAAYERWGVDCFRRFEGMWALVIADLRARRLLASRDRFGIKPLHWALDAGRLLLASEAKQIARARAARPRAHAPLVAMYLRGIRLPCLEQTFFEGIRSLPPGTWLELPFAAPPAPPAFRRYWDLSAFRCDEPDRFALAYPDAVAELAARLSAAVASHDVADVQVGALLSGGLDSSTIVSLLTQLSRAEGRERPTFSFGLRDAGPALDELQYVDGLVRRDGLVNHTTGIDAAWVAEHAGRVVRALEEPPLAPAALAQHRVFELSREHGCTVVLDGQGADEILGGYAYHQRLLLLDRAARGRLNELRRELWAIARRQACSPLDVLSAFFLRPAAARLAITRRDWLSPDYGADGRDPELRAALEDGKGDPSRLNRRLHFDVKWGNAKLILAFADRNAMAHSVEARVPYFDRGLVEFAFSLPDRYKVGDGDRKRILRDVARPRLTPEITERAGRTGFAVPDERLMRDGVWRAARARVLDAGFLASPCLRARGVARLARGYDAGHESGGRALWRLYALALWRSEFDVDLG